MADTLYISGPMRGFPDHNFPAFAKAAKDLREAGFGVISPHELHGGRLDLDWCEYIRRDLALVVSGCLTGMAVLPGWQNSSGSIKEMNAGDGVGLKIQGVDEWLQEAENARQRQA